jgi:hypothetical protein
MALDGLGILGRKGSASPYAIVQFASSNRPAIGDVQRLWYELQHIMSLFPAALRRLLQSTAIACVETPSRASSKHCENRTRGKPLV